MVFFINIQILIVNMQAISGDPDQTPCKTGASDPGLHYLPMSQEKGR